MVFHMWFHMCAPVCDHCDVGLDIVVEKKFRGRIDFVAINQHQSIAGIVKKKYLTGTDF